MVSDQEIASCVESLLRGTAAAAGGEGSGSGTASLAAVLQRAQAQLGVDLSHKAPYIRDQMDLFYGPRLQPPPPPPPKSQPQAQTTPPPPLPASAPAPAPSMVYSQPLPPQLQLPLEMQQQQQFAAMQPQYIFQTMPPQQLPPVVSGTTAAAAAVSAPPPVPAMAFYPPPPLAFRYANAAALGGVATGGTLSFQQPAPGVVGGMASPTAAAPPAGADNKESATKRKRGGPGGLNKICAISPELQAVVGDTAMSRTQIVKQLWAYIRQNNLQDPDDKRKIICNDELRIVFETDATDMFKMNKLLAKHITPLDPKDQPREAKKFKAPSPPPQQMPPPPQQMPPVNQPYIVVSDALAKFIGVQGTVPQDDALKYLWDYIKANQLEDAPSASILCDSQLQELFGCDTIPASQLSELLAHHFIQRT